MTEQEKIQDFLSRAYEPAILVRTGTPTEGFREIGIPILTHDHVPPNRIFLIDMHGLHLHDAFQYPQADRSGCFEKVKF